MPLKPLPHHATFVFSTSDSDFDPEQFAGENIPVLVVGTKQASVL